MRLDGRVRFRIALGAVLLLALLLRVFGADIPLERDEGEYAYMAWRWLAGELPYIHSFDQKPPAIFAVYTLILSTLGDSPRAIHWAMQIYSLATLASVMQLGRRLLGPVAGAGAGLATAIALTGPSLFANAANTEIFALLPLVGGMLCAHKAAMDDELAWAALAGACAAVALLFKWVVAPILLVQLALHLAPLLGRCTKRGLRHAVFLAAGALVVAAPALGYFALKGGLGDLIEATLVYNLDYVRALPLERYPETLAAQLPGIRATIVPLAILSILGAMAHAMSRDADPRPAASSLTWLWLWLASGLVAVSAGGYFRPHYFILVVPPLALLASDGILRALRVARAPAWSEPIGVAGLGLVLLAGSIWSAPGYFSHAAPDQKARQIYGWNPFPEAVAIGAYLAEHSEPDDRVFVFGSEPEIYHYARRRSATRFIYVYPLQSATSWALEQQRQVLDALTSDPPRHVVGVFEPMSLLEETGTHRLLREGLRELVATRYRPVGIVPRRGDGRSEVRSPPRALLTLADGASFTEPEPRPNLIIWERR